MVHIAIFEAFNSIEPRYTPYRARLTTEASASREAAAAAAAHHILVRAYPEQTKEFDKALEASLAAVPDGPPKTDGIRLGEQSARAMLVERNSDGANMSNTYPLYYCRYVRYHNFPVMSNWGVVRPFGLKYAHQFRPGAPYTLTIANGPRITTK